MKIYQKLLEFQSSIEAIKKDGKNTFFKKSDGKASTYATLSNILSEVKPILNSLKLVVTQPIENGVVKTKITDSEGVEFIESGISLPENLNAQQLGSAITYFRRYTLSSLLSLELDEDDDGNNTIPKPPIKHQQVNKELEQALMTLALSTTKDELITNWKRIGVDMQKQTECLNLKENLKIKLK